MNIDSILAKVAKDTGKKPEEVREANIDDTFERGNYEEDLYLKCYFKLFEHVKKDLGSDYKFESRRLDPRNIKAKDYYYIYLKKYLKITEILLNEIPILESHTMKAEVFCFDYTNLYGEQEDNLAEYYEPFRKIGAILEKIEQVYAAIEEEKPAFVENEPKPEK